MGLCTSCIRSRRRKRRTQPQERSPLLPSNDSPHRTRTPALQRGILALRALRAGKLPSQDQLSIFLRSLLHSAILRDDFVNPSRSDGKDTLSEHGKKIRNDTRRLVEVALKFGMEKNSDDLFQDFIYEYTQTGPRIKINLDAGVGGKEREEILNQAPSEEELARDANRLDESLRSIVSSLLTSATFRFLLGEVAITFRENIIVAAERVEVVAGGVAEAAIDVENVAGFPSTGVAGLRDVAQDVREIASNLTTAAPPEHFADDDTTEPGDSRSRRFARRVQAIVLQIHDDSNVEFAFLDLLVVIQKYAAKFASLRKNISTTEPISLNLHPTSPTLLYLKTILERLASNRPLDSVLDACTRLVNALVNLPISTLEGAADPLSTYVSAWNRYLTLSLDPNNGVHWARSPQASVTLTEIYQLGYDLWQVPNVDPTCLHEEQDESNVDMLGHLVEVIEQLGSFIDSIKLDHTTTSFVNALEELWKDVTNIRRASVMREAGRTKEHVKLQVQKLRKELRDDLVAWLLPRVVEVFTALMVPLPRIEYANTDVDVVVAGAFIGTHTSRGTSDYDEESGWRDVEEQGDGNVEGHMAKTTAYPDLIPDTIIVRNWTETVVDMAPAIVGADSLARRTVTSTTRAYLSIAATGLRLSINNLLYHLRYHPPAGFLHFLLLCLGGGYKDYGEATLRVGHSSAGRTDSEGMGIKIDLNINNNTDDDDGAGSLEEMEIVDRDKESSTKATLEVAKVEVTLPANSISFGLSDSHHWIVNTLFVNPLVRGPLGRRMIQTLVETWLKESADEVVLRVDRAWKGVKLAERARKRGGRRMDFAEWIGVVLSAFDVDDGNVVEVTEMNVTATTKGLVGAAKTTVLVDNQDPNSLQTSEREIAVGVGGQLFPGVEPGPGGVEPIQRSVGEVVDDVVDDVREGVRKVRNMGREGLDDIEEFADAARVRPSDLESVAKEGWKSNAFDIS